MKSIFKSKTFWIAFAQSVVGALAIFSEVYPEVGLLLMAKSVLDVVIRIYTTQGVR